MSKFKLPESLEALTEVPQVDALIDEALDAFRALGLTPESSDEDLAAGEELVAALNKLRARKGEIETAAAEIEAAAAADKAARDERARKLIAEAGVTDPDPGDPDEPETPEAPEVPEVPEEAAAPVLEAVPAAAAPITPTPSPVQRAAAAAPEVHVPQSTRTVSLVAAANVPGFATGDTLDDLSMVTTAILAKVKGLPTTNLATEGGGVRQRYGAALIHKQGPADLVQRKEAGQDLDLIWKAGDQSRLEGGSLVAAGGWCAPSEVLYDLCQYETVEGILDVPEITITRGGIRWTPGPSFDDIYQACGFEQTEADAIAGECKDCCTVECPEFDEIRMDAVGLCVKSPILTEHAYPELVRRFTEGALVAHQHKVNKYMIDRIEAAAGTAAVMADAGATSINLNGLEVQALGMRYSYRLSQTADLDVVMPFWFKSSIRIDLSMQWGRASRNVADAEIDGWFTARNMRPQWVYDWQDPDIDGCEVTLPTDATVLMYPAGTWVKGTANVIQLDAVYDSPNLEANQYTALFVEEGILAVQRCLHTCAIEIPVCNSGKQPINDIDVCLVGPTGGEPAPT